MKSFFLSSLKNSWNGFSKTEELKKTEAYFEPSQLSMMEHFVIIVNG